MAGNILCFIVGVFMGTVVGVLVMGLMAIQKNESTESNFDVLGVFEDDLK